MLSSIQMDHTRLDGTPVEAYLRDLSRGGVRLICDQALAVDFSWRLCFLQQGYMSLASRP